jgi:anti-sigma B factor antagonist
VISLSTAEGDAAGALHIAGELTVYHAAETAQQLLARIGEAPALAIDLDGVTEFDSAGIQVLLVAHRAAVAAGGTLQLLRPSRPVLDVIETFALSELLTAPVAVAAEPTSDDVPEADSDDETESETEDATDE